MRSVIKNATASFNKKAIIMYKPGKDGIERGTSSVVYSEERPPSHLGDFVHCFWELKTLKALPEDLHIIFYLMRV